MSHGGARGTRRVSAADSTAPFSATSSGDDDPALVVSWQFPERRATRLPEPGGDVSLGRDASNDVVLPGEQVSRHHVRIERRGAALAVRDLDSRNGSFVDGARRELAPLEAGSVLRIGEWVGVVTAEAAADEGFRELAPGLFGSHRLARSVADIESVASSALSVLLHGETGSGKELAARAVHRASGRAGRLVAVNCGAVADALFEAEFFGHERGAFTGADRERQGYLRLAEGGTLFLDEVAELSASGQAKLLRALQERAVTPVGGGLETRVDVRVVAASHQDLRNAVAAGRFRQDLLARLAGFEVRLPPLRERREDILPLFVARAREVLERPCPALSPSFVEALLCHRFSRNVRELLQLAERLAIVSGKRSEWRRRDLLAAHPEIPPNRPAPPVERGASPRERPSQLTRERIRTALSQANGNVAAAARALQVSKQSLYDLVRAHDIDLGALRSRR